MLQSPSSLDKEHAEIMSAFREFSKLNDRTGEAIRNLEKVLEPHFRKENAVIMPVLGSLPSLVKEEKPKQLREIAESQGAILQEYDNMFLEHDEVRKLVHVAKKISLEEGHEDVAELLDGLALHAKVEEEVLYPAALLAGTVAKCIMPPATAGAIA